MSAPSPETCEFYNILGFMGTGHHHGTFPVFARGTPVVECEGGIYVLEGKASRRIEADDWRGLLSNDEAIRVPVTVEARENVAAWVLTETQEDHIDLLRAIQSVRGACLLACPLLGTGYYLLVVDEDRLTDLRTVWVERSCLKALEYAQRREFSLAATFARRAWLMAGKQQTPEVVACLVHCLTLNGEAKRAEVYQRIETQARGVEFGGLVELALINHRLPSMFADALRSVIGDASVTVNWFYERWHMYIDHNQHTLMLMFIPLPDGQWFGASRLTETHHKDPSIEAIVRRLLEDMRDHVCVKCPAEMRDKHMSLKEFAASKLSTERNTKE